MKHTYWKRFQYDCTKRSGSPQHQAFCRSYQTLWCAIRTNWSHVWFFFSFFPPSIFLQYPPLRHRFVCNMCQSVCEEKHPPVFRSLLHSSVAIGTDPCKLMVVTKVNVQINSSGEECAEHLKQCSPIQGCCVRATSSGVRALIWHCSFVCVWVPLAPVSRFCAVVGIWDGQKTGDWFNCPLGVRNKRCTAKWFGGAFC